LGEAGAVVRSYEPYKPHAQLEGLHLVSTLEQVLADAEFIALLVRHKPFLELDPREIARQTKARLVVDAVNAWDLPSWRAAGFRVSRLGVGKPQATHVDQ
jgi:UDP-N-acetyl-D-mannosaminuronate dehydrogenase